MSEIKRYRCELEIGRSGFHSAVMEEDFDGDYVLFTDHEAAIIKAKIAVLEEFMVSMSTGGDRDRMIAKIAQLQAQLGEAGR